MSTPLKALIQERLRAKMVCRRGDYEDYECDADRLHQPLNVTTYDVSSRRDDDEVMLRNSNESTSRRNSLTQPSYPVRLHTHIDPSAYLVPSEREDGYYPPSNVYGPGGGSHDDDRHHHPRHPREQHRDATMYDPTPRPELLHRQRDQRRRNQNHHHVREQLPPRYEPPSRGGYIGRQSSENRTSVSPWHRSEQSTTPKSRSTAKSPIHTATSPSPRAHRKQDYVYPTHPDHNNPSRHRRRENKSTPSPRFVASSHQTHHQDYHQRRRNSSWKGHDHNCSEQSAYEVRDPSPTQHRGDHYPTFEKPARYSPVHHNQNGRYTGTTTPSHKPQPKETNALDNTSIPHDSGRHSPPQLDMKIIEPPAKTTGRARPWSDIMSPESRLAAKAFVEKRQRRTEKGTPRTMATQRWLEVVDARASRYEATAK